jgi:signal transduction histidine kinase/CheY-like chemotaxis protein
MASNTPVAAQKLHAALVRWFTEDTHQGLFATDHQLKVVVWNRWMELHSGRLASEVIGRPVLALYSDLGARGILDYYDGALEGRVTLLSHGLHRYVLPLPPTNADLEFAQMPQSGRIGPLSFDGQIIGTVTTIEDVSERLASEIELRKQIEAQQMARVTAEKALRAKDDFLSTLSHEMRTPLNAVLGWARILLARGDIDREFLDRAMHVIERNASAQAKMIDDMLDIARIVAGKLRLEMQPVDLLSVVLAAVDVVAPSATAKRIALRTNFDPRLPSVLGDHDRLQQVVWNLLSNALKFTEPDGSVEVRLEVLDKKARIVVRDTGQGIRKEFLPYVFDRFRQSDASSTRRHGGLGLGLALVRELVELHGGAVGADSEGEGKGATFTIDLPTMPPDMGRKREESVPFDMSTAPSLAGIHVLVVEDEFDARDLVITVLEQCGAQVTAVTSTADALTLLLDATGDPSPHVLVSDIGMPREDGYELIRQIRSLPPHRGGTIPAIAVTGYATTDDVERVLAAGFHTHVAKPMDPTILVDAVATLSRRSRG